MNSIENEEGLPWEMQLKTDTPKYNVANFKQKQLHWIAKKYPSVVNINILAGFCNCITDNLLVTHSFKVACPQYSWLRTPNEAFFLFVLRQTNWADKFWGIWGMFGKLISPLACFIYFTSEISVMGRTEISVSTLHNINICTPKQMKQAITN